MKKMMISRTLTKLKLNKSKNGEQEKVKGKEKGKKITEYISLETIESSMVDVK